MTNGFNYKYQAVKGGFEQVIKEVEREEKRRMGKAAAYLRKQVIKQIDNMGIKTHSRRLKKGIRYAREGDSYLIGATSPASHAHLIHMGTDTRYVKNYMGHQGVSVNVGYVAPKPFLTKTFQEEKDEIIKRLSEPL